MTSLFSALTDNLRPIPELADEYFAGPPKQFLLSAHERPDGDAAGSLLALTLMLEALGHTVWPQLVADPLQLGHLPLHRLHAGLPDGVDLRTNTFNGWIPILLDCATQQRAQDSQWHDTTIFLNIDHHNDNPRYGQHQLVDPASSSTCELVWRLVRQYQVPLTLPLAQCLWTGLITDTSGFNYEKAGVDAHLMAAELVQAGVKPQLMQQHIYGNMPINKLRLTADICSDLQHLHDERVIVATVRQADLQKYGLTLTATEGLVADLLLLEGVQVAILLKEIGPDEWKGSFRSADESISVNIMVSPHGGGHARAAGANYTGTHQQVLDWVHDITGSVVQ